jgi:hypothetical protein
MGDGLIVMLGNTGAVHFPPCRDAALIAISNAWSIHARRSARTAIASSLDIGLPGASPPLASIRRNAGASNVLRTSRFNR